MGKQIDTDALIDSGSNYSVFRPEFAQALGLPIERGRLTDFVGISADLSAYLHKIELQIFEKPFECEVAFTRKLHTSFNILGRVGFFDRHEITFKEKEKKVVITEIEV
jgi:hypothetical protein